jgi:hypothetical protein
MKIKCSYQFDGRAVGINVLYVCRRNTTRWLNEVNTYRSVSVRSNNILSFIMLMLLFNGSVLAPVSNSTAVSSKIW